MHTAIRPRAHLGSLTASIKEAEHKESDDEDNTDEIPPCQDMRPPIEVSEDEAVPAKQRRSRRCAAPRQPTKDPETEAEDGTVITIDGEDVCLLREGGGGDGVKALRGVQGDAEHGNEDLSQGVGGDI